MGKTEVRDAGNMKPGNLVRYTGPSYLGEPEYLGIVLEHNEVRVRILWAELNDIQDFSVLGITYKERLQVIG